MFAYFADKKLRKLPDLIDQEKRRVKNESRSAERDVARLQREISIKTSLAKDAAGRADNDEFERLCSEATDKKIELTQALQHKRDFNYTMQHLNQAHGHARSQRSRQVVCRAVERINAVVGQTSKAGSINRYDDALEGLREMQEQNENLASEANSKANEMKEQMQREMMTAIMNSSNLPTGNVNNAAHINVEAAEPAHFATPQGG